ncbi:HEAT repeat domain-containing protein [Desulfonema magnum]|nr:HEAT repeat domain-containing protein [Desulfonema magnum]
MTTCLVGNYILLLWVTIMFIIFNFYVSLTFLFEKGRITSDVILLNLAQLALFYRLHIQIYAILGPANYSYASLPRWYDWAELIIIHALRAVDLLDMIEAYGIRLQNVRNQSVVSGLALFSMHMMVDIFILGAIFNAVSRRSRESVTIMQFMEEMENTLMSPKSFLFLGLMVMLYLIGYTAEHLFKFNDYPIYSLRSDTSCPNIRILNNFYLWPLDNILRTLDFGDAFQIFGWRLHTVERTMNSATLAVCFRFMVATYTIGVVNHLYLRLLGGQGKTVEDLTAICISSKYSQGERLIALEALKKFGAYADSVAPHLIESLAYVEKQYNSTVILLKIAAPAIPHLVKALADSNPVIRDAVIEILEETDSEWPRSEEASGAIPHLVKQLANVEADVRCAALNVLEKIDTLWFQRKETRRKIPYFIKLLAHRNASIRIGSAYALIFVGPAAKKAIFRLVKMLADSNMFARGAAAAALENIDPQWQQSEFAHNAIPYLVKMLGDDEANVRDAATEVLEKIDLSWPGTKGAHSAVPYLVKVLADTENEGVRNSVRKALHKIDPF